jgi:hypothetical protein
MTPRGWHRAEVEGVPAWARVRGDRLDLAVEHVAVVAVPAPGDLVAFAGAAWRLEVVRHRRGGYRLEAARARAEDIAGAEGGADQETAPAAVTAQSDGAGADAATQEERA